MFFDVFSIDTVLSHEITSGSIRDEMVNKLFVTSTTRNKMRPKKARGRLTQSEVFFPFAYKLLLPIVLSNKAFVLFLSKIAQQLQKVVWTCKRMTTTSHCHQWPSMLCDYDYDYITRSATLVPPRANSKMHS